MAAAPKQHRPKSGWENYKDAAVGWEKKTN